jgi:hypothetical protein
MNGRQDKLGQLGTGQQPNRLAPVRQIPLIDQHFAERVKCVDVQRTVTMIELVEDAPSQLLGRLAGKGETENTIFPYPTLDQMEKTVHQRLRFARSRSGNDPHGTARMPDSGLLLLIEIPILGHGQSIPAPQPVSISRFAFRTALTMHNVGGRSTAMM